MLKAMKKQKTKLEYDSDTEISPAEQVHMQTKQYRDLKTQVKKDEAKMKAIKDVVLGGRREPIVNIGQLSNQ